MKTRSWLSIGNIAAFALSAATVAAQDAPPPTAPAAPGEKTTEDEAPPKWNEATLGFSLFKRSDNLNQYARATEGFTLNYLRLLRPAGDNSPYYRFIFRGLPNQDNAIDGYIAFNEGRTVLRGSRTQHDYYVLDWRPRAGSRDNDTRVVLEHAFNPSLGAFVAYRASGRTGRYAPPRDADRTRTNTVAAGLGGTVLGGNLGVNFADVHTFHDDGNQPQTVQRRIDATYTRDLGSTFSLEGSASLAKIEQTGLLRSGIRTLSLAGAWELSPTTTMQFSLGRQDVELDNVQNAYVRKRLDTSVRLIERWPGWSFQFGFKHKESERVRADHTYVDVPKVDVYDARLAGRLGPARLTVRGSWENLTATAGMTTEDSRQLLWDDRATFQAKLDAAGERVSGYGAYTYKFQQNKQRGVEIGWHNLLVGASYIFSPSWNGYAEYAYDAYHVVGSAETGERLGSYFPNSQTASVGLNWSQDPTWSASAGLNFFESREVRGAQVSLSLRKHIGADRDFEFTVAPWLRDDRQFGITGYRATFISARYTLRF